MRRAFKFRLYPNANQIRELEATLETHRRLYNECLEWRSFAWEVYRTSISSAEHQKWFSRQQSAGHRFYSRVNNNSANETIKRLDLAFQAFFRRVKAGQKPGYPRFQGRDRFDSVKFGTYPNGLKLIEKDGRRYVRIQHIGAVRVKYHREIQGRIKTASIKREGDRWYVVFSCDLGDVQVAPSSNPPVGIDVGLESFLTTSDGEQVANPRFLKDALPALRRLGRAVSRKKRGGSNRRKAVKRLRRQHTKVRDLRKEHHYQTANSLVRRYGMIAVERLNVQGMVRSRRFSRAIADAGWSGFVGILKHKAESAGVRVVEVDPRGTSQQCSGCGQEVRKELKVRKHDCPHCGLVLHRDENAARNILARALPARIGPAGLNLPVGEDGPRSSPSLPTFKDLTPSHPSESQPDRNCQPDLNLTPESGPSGCLNGARPRPRKRLRRLGSLPKPGPTPADLGCLIRPAQRLLWPEDTETP